ncbi:MAG: N-acetylmuramoyl-L-alanine amidase [Balneolaceae bacterium]|nr:N-acetylmuramoyl-L-alanine amidase [Balneolaceae bacterium]
MCFCLLLLLVTFSVSAQKSENILNRVSTAERSDGKGYVVRFHLAQKVDSFKVTQPETDLIQMTLYGGNISGDAIAYDTTNVVYDELGFYDLSFGVGVDLYIPAEQFYTANVYHDGQSNDLLLGLTRSTKEDVEYLADDIEPIIWSKFSVSRDSMLVGSQDADTAGSMMDDAYQRTKNNMKFDVIVIDPGHGGHDPGSIGYKGTKEKHVVMDIAKKVGGYINEYLPEVKVVYTREEDKFVELEERGSIANRAEGDLFLSIHCNSYHSRQPNGTEVFFLGLERSQSALETMKRENSVIELEKNPEQTELTQEELLIYELANSAYIATSEQLAARIDHQFENRAMRNSRGVKQARLVVLYHASMPALLVETGFISNPAEQRYLTSEYGQSIIASAIFRAVRNYKVEYEKSREF